MFFVRRFVYCMSAALVACGQAGTEPSEPDTQSIMRTTSDNRDAPMAPQAGAAHAVLVKTTVRVHHRSAASIRLRGSLAPLSWTDSLSGSLVDDVATFEVSVPTGATFELKPVIDRDDPIWSLGEAYAIVAGNTHDIYPRFFNDEGTP